MEYLNANKNVFEKKLLIEMKLRKKVFKKEAIMKKWIKSGLLDGLIIPSAIPSAISVIDTPEENDDDELDIF